MTDRSPSAWREHEPRIDRNRRMLLRQDLEYALAPIEGRKLDWLVDVISLLHSRPKP